MVVCSCLAVTHRAVGAAVAAGASTVEELTDRCQAGGGCGGCWPELQRLLDAFAAGQDEPSRSAAA